MRYIRNAGVLLNLLKTNADVREKYCNSLLSTDSQPIAKAKIELLMKKFATTLFAEVNTIDNVNKKFAKLCYHRSSIFHLGICLFIIRHSGQKYSYWWRLLHLYSATM